jgi:hypothetical protein
MVRHSRLFRRDNGATCGMLCQTERIHARGLLTRGGPCAIMRLPHLTVSDDFGFSVSIEVTLWLGQSVSGRE